MSDRKPSISIEKAIECGIGLADKAPGCDLCNGSRPGACPEHAAANVLRIMREFGYVQP